MSKIVFDDNTKSALIELYERDSIGLEGNIIKVIDPKGDKKFQKYLEDVGNNDKVVRKKRLEVTKQIQSQNKELSGWREENQKLMDELKVALKREETAKELVQNDLDILQKKTQFELIGNIVKVALWIIMGVGINVSLFYLMVVMSGKENRIIESTWSNLLSILLTNSFSIIGTVMGIKYATKKD